MANMEGAPTVAVPVDSVHKDLRGWLAILFGVLGASTATQPVQDALANHPVAAGVITVIGSGLQWFLNYQSKKNVVSKNVLVNGK